MQCRLVEIPKDTMPKQLFFYAFRILRNHRLRFVLTVAGMACCILLMLFLLAVYRGLADGSVEYVRANKTDLWVVQQDALNILRSTSILSQAHGTLLKQQVGVKEVSGVLLYLASIRTARTTATVFLTGYEVEHGMGGPPQIAAGRTLIEDNDIVLDRAFSKIHRIEIGDSVQILHETFHVVGISTSTNAFAVQYAFVSLKKARELSGFPGLTTAFLVTIVPGVNSRQITQILKAEVPGIEVYDHKTFVDNNIREMESGVLPLFYAVAALGLIVLITILSLLLSINILERRKDLALLKILGAPSGFVHWFIHFQALWISLLGFTIGTCFFFPGAILVEWLSPEISTQSSVGQVASVFAATVVIAFTSSALALRRQQTIHPAEVFYL